MKGQPTLLASWILFGWRREQEEVLICHCGEDYPISQYSVLQPEAWNTLQQGGNENAGMGLQMISK